MKHWRDNSEILENHSLSQDGINVTYAGHAGVSSTTSVACWSKAKMKWWVGARSPIWAAMDYTRSIADIDWLVPKIHCPICNMLFPKYDCEICQRNHVVIVYMVLTVFYYLYTVGICLLSDVLISTLCVK